MQHICCIAQSCFCGWRAKTLSTLQGNALSHSEAPHAPHHRQQREKSHAKENALAYKLFATLSIVFGLMVAAALWKAQKKAIKRDLARILRLETRRP